jgi:mannitol operon transcriptional antiterminator
MKHRAVEILMDIMRSADGKVFTGQLMEMYQIGDRTLRNDLKQINEYLISLGQSPLRIMAEGKILLPPKADRMFMLESLGDQALKVYTMLPREREMIQFIFLLNAGNYVTMGEIAAKMDISQVTAINDISRLRDQFLTRGIQIKSSPGRGICLIYTERSVRHVLISLLTRIFEQFDGNYNVFQNIVLGQLDFSYPLDWFWTKVNYYERQSKLNLSEDDLKIITLYFFVAMNRCLKDFYITEAEVETETELDDWKLKNLYRSIAKECSIEIRQEELAVLHNDARLFQVCAPCEENPYEYQKIKTRVIDFLGSISKQLGVNLYSDEVLLELLIQYFVNERKMNEKLDDQLILQMREDYFQIYQAVSETLDLLTDDIRYDDLEEITYIVMYLAAAIERIGLSEKKLNILIACPGGVAVGQLLASRVRRVFNFHIVGICSAGSLYYDERMKEADFVISAINIARTDKPVVVVDPMLSREDIINIYEVSYAILNRQKPPNDSVNKLEQELEKLQKTVWERQEPSDREKLETAIRSLNQAFGNPRQDGLDGLRSVFKPEYVQKVTRCDNWEQALKLAAEPLIQDHRLSREYVDATIENCKINGPYFILREGFCIAHALPDKGLIKPCLGLLFIQEGVDFGHEFFGPVHMLFYTCFRESGQWNLKILRSLISLAEDNVKCGEIAAQDCQRMYEGILKIIAEDL